MDNFRDTDDGNVVVITTKTYADGLEEGKRIGKEQGFNSGLAVGQDNCRAQRQAEQAEKERQAAVEARRMFWDTAYQDGSKVDPRAEAGKADVNLKSFINDVQAMNIKEFLSTEKELNDNYDAKKADYKRNHKWWDIIHPEPSSPMVVTRENNGIVTSIDFPSQGYKIPVTYWNSETEAAKLQTLADGVNRAGGPIERDIAQKSLAEELSRLKIPQIAQLEAHRLTQGK